MITPGIYPQMPAEEYHAIDACSSSRLKLLKRSPAHCKHSVDFPNGNKSPAMVTGSAVHCAVLEPECFDSRYIVKPKFSGKGSVAARVSWEVQQEMMGFGGEYLDADDRMLAQRLTVELYGHRIAGPILRQKSQVEISGIWIDSPTSLLCKLRSDAVSAKLNMVVDLKTTDDASPGAFSASIFKYGYHRQGAMYLDGWKALGIEYRHYCIIAVEKKAPYGVAVYRLNTEGRAIELGRKENRALINRYAQCKAENNWPSYPEVITDIELPAWAERQINEEYRDDV